MAIVLGQAVLAIISITHWPPGNAATEARKL
jgi:hypothetical protein